jgi:isopentenyl-diphosphate Delta-isomerase
MEKVILVDENDQEIGVMDKMEAHLQGLLHRAFSILIFNDKGQLLLQKRAQSKYHSGGLWTNTCCSHPIPNEPIETTVKRRLVEEMGLECTPRFFYKFIYRAELDSNMIEHELDYVFTAFCGGEPTLNPEEAEDWKYIDLEELKEDINQNPEKYTFWFRLIMEQLEQTPVPSLG